MQVEKGCEKIRGEKRRSASRRVRMEKGYE